MKKGLLLIFTIVISLMIGCSKYDDGELRSMINGQGERITTLEGLVASINTEISSIKTILTALQNNDYVTSVTELADKSGYTINFAKSGSITIKHGTTGSSGKNAPIVGVKQEAGVYYWTITVDGKTEWITDDKGDKLRVTGATGATGTSGSTPVLSIGTDGYWRLNGSYLLDAGGSKVMARVGEPVSAIEHKVDEKTVTFTFNSGDVAVFRYEQPMVFNCDDAREGLISLDGDEESVTVKIEIAGLANDNYASIAAIIVGKLGSDADVVTRAVPTGAKWNVTVAKPDFTDPDKPFVNVTITLPDVSVSTHANNRSAVMTIRVVDKNGVTSSTDYALRVTGNVNITPPVNFNIDNGSSYTFPAVNDDNPGEKYNVTFSIPESKTGADGTTPFEFVIPAEYNGKVDVITIIVPSSSKFLDIKIDNADFDGTVIIKGTGGSVVATGGLDINLPKGSFELSNATVDGSIIIVTKPGTFTVKSNAKIKGNLTINGGNAVVEDGAVIEGKIYVKGASSLSMGGKKYATKDVSKLTAQWYGISYGIDITPTIPLNIGLNYLVTYSSFDVNSINYRQLKEIKYSLYSDSDYNTRLCSATMAIDVNIPTPAEFAATVNAQINMLGNKLPSEAEIDAIVASYIGKVPSDKQSEVMGVVTKLKSALSGIKGYAMPTPVLPNLPVATYFEAGNNITLDDVESLIKTVNTLLTVMNNLQAAAAEVDRLQAEYDAASGFSKAIKGAELAVAKLAKLAAEKAAEETGLTTDVVNLLNQIMPIVQQAVPVLESVNGTINDIKSKNPWKYTDKLNSTDVVNGIVVDLNFYDKIYVTIKK